MIATDATFKQLVLESDKPVLVDFWASWCPPCKMMDALIDTLEKEYEGRITVCRVNVDQNVISAARYHVAGVPTFVLFVKGEAVETKVGAQTEPALRAVLESAVLE